MNQKELINQIKSLPSKLGFMAVKEITHVKCDVCNNPILLCQKCGVKFNKNMAVLCRNKTEHFCEKCVKEGV